ncbi:hypothetical protein [Niabella digestorum]|uniref:Uncharacterized protein n=1 Tax=Niabella digestorum TaxID=3117701 RepID=A0ABU7REV7_9BACT
MENELNKILHGPKKNVDAELLLKYLNDELSNAEKHELEMHLLDEDFDNEALEGLQQVANKERIRLIVDGLNRDLKNRTSRRKRRREQLSLKPLWWLYFSILILLIIIVMIYLYLHTKF